MVCSPSLSASLSSLSPHYKLILLAPFSSHTANIYRQWFTFCFVPLIPFSLKPYKEVGCHICHFFQDIKYRPDVQQQMGMSGGNAEGAGGVMMHGGAGGPPGQGGQGYGPPPAGVPYQGQYK
jgi:hypothetical protein